MAFMRLSRAGRGWVLALLIAVLTAPAVAGPKEDYEQGERSYRAGDVIGAMAQLKKSADAGHAPAQALLGEILDRAEFDEDAVELFRKAAEQGNADGELGLGLMYASGEGVKRDVAQAVKWVSSAAQKGHARAINTLAQAYLNGDWGLVEGKRDNGVALGWIRKAAEGNYLPALDGLARAYRNGEFGLAPDAEQVKVWESKAKALRGDPARDARGRRR
ncbi:MAG: sel1 repeat family protein [Betaproteobacteria bacterium]|nr:sel1 repeat family protein [Betaproteobacteria bacterium]